MSLNFFFKFSKIWTIYSFRWWIHILGLKTNISHQTVPNKFNFCHWHLKCRFYTRAPKGRRVEIGIHMICYISYVAYQSINRGCSKSENLRPVRSSNFGGSDFSTQKNLVQRVSGFLVRFVVRISGRINRADPCFGPEFRIFPKSRLPTVRDWPVRATMLPTSVIFSKCHI